VVATRLKSAALLYWLLLNAEDYVTQHMAVLTSGMYRACVDEEAQVVKDVRPLQNIDIYSQLLINRHLLFS
jgi:dynein assembly factor 5